RLHIDDLVALHRHGNGHIAAETFGDARESDRVRLGEDNGASQCERDQDERNNNEALLTLHLRSSSRVVNVNMFTSNDGTRDATVARILILSFSRASREEQRS